MSLRSTTALRAATRAASASARAPQRALSLLARQAPRATLASAQTTAVRGIKTLDFAGTKEVVYERADWPAEKLQEWVLFFLVP